MNKQRVDIEFNLEDLEWAKIEADKLGMSRRKFLAMCVSKARKFSIYEQTIKGK